MQEVRLRSLSSAVTSEAAATAALLQVPASVGPLDSLLGSLGHYNYVLLPTTTYVRKYKYSLVSTFSHCRRQLEFRYSSV